MSVEVIKLGHAYEGRRVLNEISFSIDDGKILCILGPSGSGKSSLLRILAGLEDLKEGVLLLDGLPFASPENSPTPEYRSVGLVFQDHALFPHLTILENIAFGLDYLPRRRRNQISAEMLPKVGLPDVLHRYPHTLSGGEQQRVALARALATQPRLMLMDEPFASVDVPLRKRLCEDARTSLKALGSSAVIVTHDAEEAMTLADEILVLVDGNGVELGTPFELYNKPKHPFTAQAIAKREMISGRVEESKVVTSFGTIELPTAQPRASNQLENNQEVTLAVVQGTLTFQISENGIEIQDIRFEMTHWCALFFVQQERLTVRMTHSHQFKVGDRVNFNFAESDFIIYN